MWRKMRKSPLGSGSDDAARRGRHVEVIVETWGEGSSHAGVVIVSHVDANGMRRSLETSAPREAPSAEQAKTQREMGGGSRLIIRDYIMAGQDMVKGGWSCSLQRFKSGSDAKHLRLL